MEIHHRGEILPPASEGGKGCLSKAISASVSPFPPQLCPLCQQHCTNPGQEKAAALLQSSQLHPESSWGCIHWHQAVPFCSLTVHVILQVPDVLFFSNKYLKPEPVVVVSICKKSEDKERKQCLVMPRLRLSRGKDTDRDHEPTNQGYSLKQNAKIQRDFSSLGLGGSWVRNSACGQTPRGSSKTETLCAVLVWVVKLISAAVGPLFYSRWDYVGRFNHKFLSKLQMQGKC